jgi:hypothetical protein
LAAEAFAGCGNITSACPVRQIYIVETEYIMMDDGYAGGSYPRAGVI